MLSKMKWLFFLVFLTVFLTAQSLRSPDEGDRREKCCECKGDPHCQQFDADKHDPKSWLYLKGSCWRTMVTDGCEEGGVEPSFSIDAKFQQKLGTKQSYVTKVQCSGSFNDWSSSVKPKDSKPYVKVDLQKCDTKVDGVDDAIIHEDKAKAIIIVKIPIHIGSKLITMTFDCHKSEVKICLQWMDPAKEEPTPPKICGICGNMDGDPTNDQVIGFHHRGGPQAVDGCPAKLVDGDFGDEAKNHAEFGNSWLTEPIITGLCSMECEAK